VRSNRADNQKISGLLADSSVGRLIEVLSPSKIFGLKLVFEEVYVWGTDIYVIYSHLIEIITQ
jgi:hypothetical protein